MMDGTPNPDAPQPMESLTPDEKKQCAATRASIEKEMDKLLEGKSDENRARVTAFF